MPSMSSFVAHPSATTTTPPVDPIVQNDGWWPDIDMDDLRSSTRIDNTVTPQRLRQAVVWAVQSINNECAKWQAKQIAEGYASLADVPAPTVAGNSIKLIQYRTAIYASVQVEVLEQYRDLDTTRAGERRADAADERTPLAMRTVRNAVHDLLGRPRWIAEAL